MSLGAGTLPAGGGGGLVAAAVPSGVGDGVTWGMAVGLPGPARAEGVMPAGLLCVAVMCGVLVTGALVGMGVAVAGSGTGVWVRGTAVCVAGGALVGVGLGNACVMVSAVGVGVGAAAGEPQAASTNIKMMSKRGSYHFIICFVMLHFIREEETPRSTDSLVTS